MTTQGCRDTSQRAFGVLVMPPAPHQEVVGVGSVLDEGGHLTIGCWHPLDSSGNSPGGCCHPAAFGGGCGLTTGFWLALLGAVCVRLRGQGLDVASGGGGWFSGTCGWFQENEQPSFRKF